MLRALFARNNTFQRKNTMHNCIKHNDTTNEERRNNIGAKGVGVEGSGGRGNINDQELALIIS